MNLTDCAITESVQQAGARSGWIVEELVRVWIGFWVPHPLLFKGGLDSTQPNSHHQAVRPSLFL
jgi:hypothetical protein